MSELATTAPAVLVDLATVREAKTTLSAEQATRVTAEIRNALGYAQELLRVAFVGKAHEVLGYGAGMAGWEAYYDDNFGEIVFSLGLEQRRAEVEAWMAVGASVRVMAKALKASVGTVSTDRKALGGPAEVVSLDGRRRDAAAASAKAVEAAVVAPAKRRAVPLTAKVEAMLHRAGPAGLTSKEARTALRQHHGEVSAVFTALKQQRRAYPTGERRDGYGVLVHPEHLVIDAEVVD